MKFFLIFLAFSVALSYYEVGVSADEDTDDWSDSAPQLRSVLEATPRRKGSNPNTWGPGNSRSGSNPWGEDEPDDYRIRAKTGSNPNTWGPSNSRSGARSWGPDEPDDYRIRAKPESGSNAWGSDRRAWGPGYYRPDPLPGSDRRSWGPGNYRPDPLLGSDPRTWGPHNYRDRWSPSEDNNDDFDLEDDKPVRDNPSLKRIVFG